MFLSDTLFFKGIAFIIGGEFSMTKEFMDNKIRDSLGGYGFIINYDNYEMQYINKIWCKDLKITDNSYVGKKCYSVLYDRESPCEDCHMNHLRRHNNFRTHRYIDTTGQYYLLNNSLFDNEGTTYMLSIAYEITDEVVEINKLREHVKLDNAILHCARTLVYESDFDVAINKLLKIICDFNQADHTLLFERDYSRNITSISYAHSSAKLNFSDYIEKNFVYSLSGTMTGLEKIFQNHPYLFVESDDINLESYGYCADILALVGNKNLLLVPLKIDRIVVGSIVVVNVNDYSPNFQLLTTVSAFISNNLNIKYARKKLEKMVLNLQSKIQLNDLIMEATKTLIEVDHVEINQSVETLLKIISDHFGTRGVYVFKLNDNEDKLFNRFEYLKGIESSVTDFTEVSFDVINRWFRAYQKDDVIFVKSVVSELPDNSIEYNWLVSKQVNSFIATPLYQSKDIIGYLWIDSPTKNFEEISVIKTIATLVISHVSKYDLVKQLEHLSYNDDLTGLYNRNFFMKCIQQINTQSRQNIGVIFADVNGLKKANDMLGHEFGDILIKWCAKFFKKHIHGYIFRIGGDEFVAIMEKVDKDYFDYSVENMNNELEKFTDIHLSIGSVWEQDVQDIEALIRTADELMYSNKIEYYNSKEETGLSQEEELSMLKSAILSLK